MDILKELSQVLPGYEVRASQQKMMEAVQEAFEKNQIALIEAGTGTGKSLAYLLPACFFALSKKVKVVISTHTIALQEQLLFKDIPLVQKILKLPFKAVLVKGMSNYICLRKLNDLSENSLFLNDQEKEEVDRLSSWAKSSKDGSKASLPMAPSQEIWEQVVAERDACTHRKCSYFSACPFFKARQSAEEAQILVVNHHLFFSDLSLRSEMGNFEETALLPAYSKVIFDEAHHVENVATMHFSAKVSQFFLLKLLGKLLSEKEGQALGKLQQLKEKLLNTSFPERSTFFVRINVEIPGLRRELQKALFDTFQSFEHFLGISHTPDQKLRLQKMHFDHSFWQKEVLPRSETLIDSIRRFCVTVSQFDEALKNTLPPAFVESTKGLRLDILALLTKINGQADLLESFLKEPLTKENVRWIEVASIQSVPHIELVKARLNIDEKLQEALFQKVETAILCSATLASHQQFNHLKETLGIASLQNKTIERVLPSPFDYPNQALFIVPKDLSPPDSETFLQEVNLAIIDALKASRGNAFILFTSYQMLNLCFRSVQEAFRGNSLHFLKQGMGPFPWLLNQFKNQKNAVLFGTSSFWEGVDIVGDTLQLVILVKLPFHVPSDPLAEAKAEALLKKGKSPFFDLALPSAICKFKQGFGRLIRTSQDRGCVLCLDQRLVTKPYGKLILEALPPCQKEAITKTQILPRLRGFYHIYNKTKK